MIVIIPNSIDKPIRKEILNALDNQTILLEIKEYKNDRKSDIKEHKRLSEAIGRNQGLENLDSQEFFVMMDSDVLPNNTDIETMARYLKTHSELDGVAIDTKNYGLNEKDHLDWITKAKFRNHVVIAFSCFRTEKLKSFRFKIEETKRCLCKQINDNFNIDYLPNTQCKELKNTY